MPNKPLISVITVTYNAAASIEETIKSVIEKLGSGNEFIIIDGGSVDRTIEIIKKYKEHINYWISEPDKGIYDAMNKAIKVATGAYLYFINAGDLLLGLPTDILTSYEASAAKLLAFPVLDSNHKLRLPAINSSIKIKNLLPHQGCFYKRDLNIQYSLKFKVFSDFDLNQKLYSQKYPIKVFNEPVVATHELTGISHDKRYGKEIFKVVEGNFGPIYKCLSFAYFKMDGLYNRIKNL
ncbi:glycosyltransferase [Mucilaginibacter rubeus]|nr:MULTISPECIES: glycosyltransferase [Mucilaginibacter]QEM08211.1 glycosyltransferase [Mucilaginibacter rubeus]QEM20662.1 glycosyltransferase [Mucilaginibacter gossypii]